MNPLGAISHLRAKLEAHRAKALRDAITREQRSRVLQIIQTHLPRQKDMKARQTAVDAATDEIMEVFENYHHAPSEKFDT